MTNFSLLLHKLLNLITVCLPIMLVREKERRVLLLSIFSMRLTNRPGVIEAEAAHFESIMINTGGTETDHYWG